MYGEGRQQLRDYIINKRASEGLGDIPEDLFAKKPHHEMTEEELQSMMERRKRNKEAAERSRRKKKVEFEKLQNENDQLNQDKCELVAMVQKLKSDIDAMNKENEMLRENFEHLKRWIGKRSVELGLVKYIPNDDQNKEDLREAEAPQDDHLKYESDGGVSMENATTECGQPSSPKRRRISKDDPGQPVPRHQVQTPWCVEPVSSRKEKPAGESGFATIPQPLAHPVAPLPESQPFMLTNGQPIVYLPKDAVIVFQGDNRPFLKGSTESHAVLRASPKIAVEPPEAQSTELPKMSSSMASLSRNVGVGQATFAQEEEAKGTGFRDIPTDMDPAKATAIESLLRLGCKIQMPEPSMEWVQNRTCED